MPVFLSRILLAAALISCGSGTNQKSETSATNDSANTSTPNGISVADNEGIAGDITLPPGFASSAVTNGEGNNRHIAINSNGDIYVKLAKLKDGKGILVYRDINKDGSYEVVNRFGNYKGTGIAIRNGYLYASSDEDVFRYKFNSNNEIADTEKPERIIKGLLNKGQHASKSIALDNAGNIYVNIGAPSNACQEQDRTAGSKGQDPCPILEKAAGIWQFKADKTDQSYEQGVRYATGLRNVVGLDWNTSTNSLYAMQHGRDQLSTLHPGMYNDRESAELPAEEFFQIIKGGDYGWPYCYYDPSQKKKLLGPEYGGDKIKTGRCDGKQKPIMAFPAHWAPNAVLFYTGSMFPARYRNGAFIAFHGSWNRAPYKQAGFNVVFVPFVNGKPSGEYEIFADGFTGKGEVNGPNQAKYRPCGLAQGTDGSIFISDSREGKIWKVTYKK